MIIYPDEALVMAVPGNVKARPLSAFLNEVSAQTGKKISTAQAALFTDQANAIKTGLGCT